MTAIPEIKAFLRCATPPRWIEAALQAPDILLIDHANCELKAAQTAQGLMWKYGMNNVEKGPYNLDDSVAFTLLNKMSRLAREELRHFEQVLGFMKKRQITYVQLSAARYAAELRQAARTHEPAKLVDTLLIGAIIEARSCERFEALAPHLDDVLQKFYLSLLKSEARHYQDYLALAGLLESSAVIEKQLDKFLKLEQSLIESTDTVFRFHSGVPFHGGAAGA
ncbi:tRNA isopentenyl-2-thiomethyl-A-37 hydroxylase MiaE [Simiduia curdlanivorans]|uniref:tRNA-(Ms[2]io[6]A)-hydroxylase n=1 Tax=Simiduia curdlanivorans TaxID=1492769 RepID=A0ABV8V8K3_9GAMM|nr:tRNA isopentenyl-2-thiomethyl-A-37 hydroxylase MiaE [Simiduia curdlanivorans]MDN3639420.1 tRNA isopentenyl-2-thiomethyl-A-37 hydroxylase MiaE [Simiduia curdlanivorans]